MSASEARRFLTFEGSEGAGKSTQIRRLEARLLALGQSVLTVREPGGTGLGERLRGLLKENAADLAICQEAELFLFLAARAQLVREAVEPALRKGSWVLADRFGDSTLAYQGGGRGFPQPLLRSWNELASAGLEPTITFVLDIPPAVGRARLARRNEEGGGTDRIESEPVEFFERVRNAYREMAAREPDRIVLLDGDRSPDQVADEIWARVRHVFEF